MGRTLKRVALEFSWPLGKVWEGYINAYPGTSCRKCGGSGYAPHARLFADQWYGSSHFDPVQYGAKPLTVDHPAIRALAERNCASSPSYYGSGSEVITREAHREAHRLFDLWKNQWCHHLIQADVDALIAADRLWDFTRVPRNEEQREVVRKKVADGENSWLPYPNGYTPTADEVNDWSIRGLGHDAINRGVCVRARCERKGVAVTCENCGGDGTVWPDDEAKRLHDEWKAYEPPVGEGYQLWETTSEGSPQSPVFLTLDELCRWCEKNATTFADFKATAAKWKEMLQEGFVSHQENGMVYL